MRIYNCNYANTASANLQTDLIAEMCKYAHMDIQQKKAVEFIRKAMDHTGLDATNLARRAKIAPSTLTRILNGTVKNTLSARTIIKVAEIAGLPNPLTVDEISPMKNIPLYGYVGAGDKVYPVESDGPIDHVTTPFSADIDVSALIIRGDSMFPVYWDGDMVFFSADRRMDPRELLMTECIVYLKSGEVYIKQIHPSRTEGKYMLISYNAPPILEQEIEWASPIIFVDRRNRKP